LNAVWASSG